MEAVRRFLVGGGFPAFALSLITLWEILLIAVLLTPSGETGLGAFAEEFRVWCFASDPTTGRVEFAYVFGMLLPPFFLAATLLLLWWEPLRLLTAQPRRLAGSVVAAAILVAGAGTSFALSSSNGNGAPAFPADALRTSHEPPQLVLTNQREETVDLAAMRGQVVVLTGVYASCPHTCPLILAQAKNAIAKLSDEERVDLRVVAVTMDPGHDSPAVLDDLAGRHGLEPPLYNLATGDVAEVEGILDAMGIIRHRDPETGIIDHANLFVLVDRDGRVAYRLGLGELQERWLVSALRVLLRERSDTG
jgi:protein SCO1/2